jgi:signal transduction histidine kinase
MPESENAAERQRWSSVFSATDNVALRALFGVNRIYWLVVLYAGVWISLRASGVGGPPLSRPAQVGIALIFLVAVVNLFLRTRSAVLRGGYGSAHPTKIGWLFTTIDLAAITAGLRLTGGADSGLWPVLIVVVVAETVLERTPETWAVRSGAAFALLLATVPWPLDSAPWQPWLLDLTTRLFFLFVISSVTRRLRENSDREKAELAALRAELALSNQRGTLSREVHDGVGNSLAATVLRLELAARLAEKRGDEETCVLLRDEAQALRQAMTAVRDWTFFTRPWSPGALVQEVERLSRRTGLAMSVEGAELLDALPTNTTLGLTAVRIVQEALTNAAKHAAGATHVRVRLAQDGGGGWLTLTIADDGSGLSEDAGAGIGMTSMRERAEGAGGALRVESAPGAGVSVIARLPAA